MQVLLLLVAVSTLNLATCYEKCGEKFCPPSLPKHQEPPATPLPKLIGLDNATGCYCRGKYSRTVCYGRTRCTSMPKVLPILSPILKLTNTHIMQLGPDDFDNLHQLRDLQIEGNYDLKTILPGTFRNLSNLVNLSLSFNTQLKTLHPDIFIGLNNLERLYLNNNAFMNLQEITLTLRPKIVPKLMTLILDSNNFVDIGKDDFKSMTGTSLKELSMVLCRIEDIHPQALTPLKKLKNLQLGENSVNSTVLTDVLQHMVEANIDLKTLNLFYMGFKKRPPRSLMEVIAKTNISRLNLSNNQFEVLTNESFPFMPNLQYLDLEEILAVEISDDAFSNLPNLKTLIISGNKLSRIPKGVLILHNLTVLDIQGNSPGDNLHFYFRLQDEQFSEMKNLIYLNLGYNGISHLFDTSFVGLTQLEELELKNSSIFHIEKGSFVPLQNLKKLNLMNNLLVHDDSVPNVFSTLTKLEVLHLGNCNIKYITKNANPFENLKSLKYLGLEKNFLTAIAPTDFKPLTSINEINLSFNLLNSWEEKIFHYNKNLTKLGASKNKISDITLAMFQDFSQLKIVDLDQNVIHCSCLVTYKAYNLFIQDWNSSGITNGSVFDPTIYCTYPDSLDNVTLIDYLTEDYYARSICTIVPDNLYLILPLACLGIFFSILGGLAFYYRWHIKYWIFLSKLYLSRKGKIRPKREKTGYSNYQYDAFVSYSNEDRDFVIKMVTMLENNEPFFRLCVYERDFQIGTIISENILESVAKSRKTLLIISDNYAKSQWCRWESQICEHHRLFFENEDGEYVDDSLILIKLNTVSEHHLTPTLKYLLKTRIYLQWEFDERKQESFWEKLRNTLGPSAVISEITHM